MPRPLPSRLFSPNVRRLAALLLAGLTAFVGCANPVPPSGGPRDQTPPRIASSTPAAEATEVSGQTVELVFSEYVERESLREALTVTPAPGGRLEFEWGGRDVEITFPEPLRDSTTYLLTIDKALSDVRGVSLERPITLAFATGAQIDRGRLAGRVVESGQGQGREGLDVYAYAGSTAERASLPEAGPLYRTQTGPDGAFEFNYMREDLPYYVVVLRDQNRNYQADPLEAFAVPPRPALAARTAEAGRAPSAPAPAAGSAPARPPRPDSAAPGSPPADSGRPAPLQARAGEADSLSIEAPWVVGREDSVPPRLTGALPLSQSRFALRFNEPVRLRSRTPGRFVLTDTTTGRAVAVRSVYQRPDQEQRLTLRTAPMQPNGHRARLQGDSARAGSPAAPQPALTDTAGNAPALPAAAAFTAPENADTLGLRFRGFEKSGPPLPVSGEGGALVLAPGQAPVVQFTQPLEGDSAGAQAGAVVTARDTATGQPLPLQLDTDDGTTYRVAFEASLDSGQVARLRVNARRLRPPADTVYTRLVRRLPPSALGAVSGAVQIAQRLPSSREAAPADSAAASAAAADSISADSLVAGATAADSTTADATATDTAVVEAAAASAPVLVQLYPAEGEGGGAPLRTTRADSSGGFVFRGLPDASYRFRAFLDRDADRVWDPGRLAPYRPAEPLTWSGQPIRARPRWETATEDTLQIDDVRASLTN